MNLCRFDDSRFGVVDPEERLVYDVTGFIDELGGSDRGKFDDELLLVLPRLLELDARTVRANTSFLLDNVRLLSPVSRPSKILAAPDNYRAHLEEMEKSGHSGRKPSTLLKDGLFLKASSSIAGPDQGIDLRFLDRLTHHEIELVAVIGLNESVAGYCIGLDVTLRGTEERSIRKSIDGYSVVGPWMVTADALDPNAIDLQLSVNGVIRQRTSTSDLISDVATLVAYARQFYTLRPGDLIFTGTPSGVGPLAPGDRIEASASGIGVMRVDVRAYVP